jgi:acyl-coenzyme A synthetase/AMP-(fatty) acid ligase
MAEAMDCATPSRRERLIHRLSQYGVCAGHTVAVVSARNAAGLDLVDALTSAGCQHLLIEPDAAVEHIAARVEQAGIKLVFALTDCPKIVERLRVCVAYPHA